MTVDELERARVGLCVACAWLRRIPSSRSQTYYLCERSTVDPGFRRYPVVPIVQCRGFDPVDPGAGRSTSE